MNVIELRSDLHSMIDRITDTSILSAVKTLLSKQEAKTEDWWDVISEEERQEIQQGLAEIERGEVIPHEEVMAKYQKWL
jgi:predicted transcriptional regulator